MSVQLFRLFFLLFFSSTSTSTYAGAPAAASLPRLPLSTSSRWIVDDSGRRVKLACANWAAHLEPAVAEGLSKQPLDAISKRVAGMGFNCVRLTWPTYLLTNASLGSLTVRQSLARLGLLESVAGVRANNPELLDRTLVQAFQAVVSNLASNNIMIILDNQISEPKWCCSKYDDNGFFGDKYFDPDEWLQGLEVMATMFNSTNNVVGMSLRNELRGPKQNVSLWYRYMQTGAETIHAANPRLLVILSGLDYDKDLSFLSEQQVELTFTRKLVFELHWYGFSDGGDWQNGNVNEVCGMVVGNITRKGSFLLEKGWPLFLSEFGVDQGGGNIPDNRFLSCFVSVAAELDVDWAIWALQGSYYIREGQPGFDETYGVLSWDWCKARNANFLKRMAALQSPFQGPGLPIEESYSVIFHPLTGLCVLVKSEKNMLVLGPCAESEAWIYTRRHNLMIKGKKYCLRAEGVGQPARVGTNCKSSSSRWELISDSKMHLSSKASYNSTSLCLDMDSDGSLFTNPCNCLNKNGTCSPESQWFKIIRSNRELVSQKSNTMSSWLRYVWSSLNSLSDEKIVMEPSLELNF